VTALRAEALNGAGVLAANQGNFDMAATWFEESLDLYRTLGNLARQVMLLANLGCMALQQGAFHRAGAVLGEGLTLAQDVDDDAYARLLIHSNLGSWRCGRATIRAPVMNWIRALPWRASGAIKLIFAPRSSVSGW
jgi:tetratricopeptide (TPR) repeat protein